MNKAIPHDSAKLHVTGEARYVDDIPLPAKTLHLAFGLSSIAKGQVKSIDLSAVREAPGVVDIEKFRSERGTRSDRGKNIRLQSLSHSLSHD